MEEMSQASRSRRALVVVAVVAIVAVVGVLAWSARPGQDNTAAPDDSAGTGSVSSAADLPIGMLDIHDPKPDEPAPDFVLEQADGTKVRLSDFQGRPVFLNFWADWCPFCKEEMPDMQAVQDEFGDELVVVGVNVGDPVDVGESFVKSVGVSYTILYDKELDVNDGYRVQVMPTSYFIDSSGNVADFNFGFMTFEQMMEKVAGAMGSEG